MILFCFVLVLLTAYYGSFLCFSDGARLYRYNSDGMFVMAATLAEFPSRYCVLLTCLTAIPGLI